MTMRFEGREVLITGANRGLGRAFAECLAGAGARVIVHSSGRDDSGEDVVESIKRQGGSAAGVSMDLVDGAALIDSVLSIAPRLDGVVHSAGFVQDRTLAKLNQSSWDEVLHIHLTVAYQIARAVWPRFREGNFGRLVLISSAAGLYGNFGQANYAAAKMGLYGLCRTLALEGKKYGIGVNAVAPWGTTDMNRAQMDKLLQSRIRAEHVAPLVAYLCHSECEENGGLFEAGGGRFKKLRWERSAGLSLDPSRPVSIDDIASNWELLTDFGVSEHPQDMLEALSAFSEV